MIASYAPVLNTKGFGPLGIIDPADAAGVTGDVDGLTLTNGLPLTVGAEQVLTVKGGRRLHIILPPLSRSGPFPRVSLLQGQQ
jgi:hypothetical protein